MKPQYQKLKQYVTDRIDRGEWVEGSRVASDNELATQFGVSRMTANRALRELTSEGVLTRVSGVGTFVAAQLPQVPLLEVRNIADEIRERSHQYASRLIALKTVKASEEFAQRLGVEHGARVFYSLLIHLENDIPVQLEERWVNPLAAPEYLKQDFSAVTPYEYLMKVAPLTEAEHIVEAILPDTDTRQHLEIGAKTACLLVHRRTWSGDIVVSAADLIHPGNRYRMGGRFVPTGLNGPKDSQRQRN